MVACLSMPHGKFTTFVCGSGSWVALLFGLRARPKGSFSLHESNESLCSISPIVTLRLESYDSPAESWTSAFLK